MAVEALTEVDGGVQDLEGQLRAQSKRNEGCFPPAAPAATAGNFSPTGAVTMGNGMLVTSSAVPIALQGGGGGGGVSVPGSIVADGNSNGIQGGTSATGGASGGGGGGRNSLEGRIKHAKVNGGFAPVGNAAAAAAPAVTTVSSTKASGSVRPRRGGAVAPVASCGPAAGAAAAESDAEEGPAVDVGDEGAIDAASSSPLSPSSRREGGKSNSLLAAIVAVLSPQEGDGTRPSPSHATSAAAGAASASAASATGATAARNSSATPTATASQAAAPPGSPKGSPAGATATSATTSAPSLTAGKAAADCGQTPIGAVEPVKVSEMPEAGKVETATAGEGAGQGRRGGGCGDGMASKRGAEIGSMDVDGGEAVGEDHGDDDDDDDDGVLL